MEKVYGILGGDNRNIKLAKLLAKENNIVYTYGLEEAEELLGISKIYNCNSVEELASSSGIIVGPIPFSKDGVNVLMPYSNQKITIKECVKKICNNNKLVVGQVSDDIYNLAKDSNLEIVDIMKCEELVILNTIATAEGTIQVLMKNTDTILQGLSVLILGFGKVAKTLAYKLYNMQMDVTCAVRKSTDLAWISAYGYNGKNIHELSSYIGDYDIIINTIPAIVVGKKEVEKINNEALVVDLASYPGGIDIDEIKKKDIKYVWALGLPGKVAPETSAKYIRQTIELYL